VAERLFSPFWYRVAGLKPRLRAHVRIHRHVYRGQRWYVLDNTAAQKQHRFAPAAHYVISLLDGRRSVAEGVHSAAAVVRLAASLAVEMPICQAVDGILNHGHSIEAEAEQLLSRPLKDELSPEFIDNLSRGRS